MTKTAVSYRILILGLELMSAFGLYVFHIVEYEKSLNNIYLASNKHIWLAHLPILYTRN